MSPGEKIGAAVLVALIAIAAVAAYLSAQSSVACCDPEPTATLERS